MSDTKQPEEGLEKYAVVRGDKEKTAAQGAARDAKKFLEGKKMLPAKDKERQP